MSFLDYMITSFSKIYHLFKNFKEQLHFGNRYVLVFSFYIL